MSGRKLTDVVTVRGVYLLDLRIVDVIPICMCLVCSISVTFVSEKDGSETTVQAPIGQHLLEVAHKNDIELEGVFQQFSSVCAPRTLLVLPCK